MKVILLAGGFGSRLSEETAQIPKPMVRIGDKPILWHIMKLYASFGYHDFIICLGYKGYVIKEWFANYFLHTTDVTIDLKNNEFEYHSSQTEPWKVTLVETGLNTMTGGRIKRVRPYVEDKPFMLTYGDGLADVNIKELVSFHQKHGKIGTMTAVQPSGRFGSLEIEGTKVNSFKEKPKGDGGWINGGFFVFQPEMFDYIGGGDETIFERQPLEDVTEAGELQVFHHGGFWKPMDTLRDKIELVDLWSDGHAPWKLW